MAKRREPAFIEVVFRVLTLVAWFSVMYAVLAKDPWLIPLPALWLIVTAIDEAGQRE